jgi:putative ABC transport system permease protein
MDPQNQNITMTKAYYESLELPYRADFIYTDMEINTNENINGVTSIQNIKEVTSGLDNMLDTLQTMVYLIMIFACILGIVIIYNIGLLSFSEKEYQFATLKVLGFSNFKIGRIFIKQNIWISIVSILIGVPLGSYTLSYIFTNALSVDYDFRAYVSPTSLLTTAVITFVLTLIVSFILSLKIRKIDMVTSLKGDE